MGTLQPEDLLVDDLLDFSCGDIGALCEEGDDFAPPACEQNHQHSASHVPAVISSALERSSDHSQETSELLHAPPEELAEELEWLSTFVEDSYRGKDQSMPLVSSEQWFSKGGSSRKEGWCPENTSLSRATSWLRMDNSGIFCQILDVGSSPLIERSPGAEPVKEKRGWDKKGRSKRFSRSGGRVWSLQTVVRERGCEEDDDEEEHSQTSSLDYEPFDRHSEGEERPPFRKRAKKERVGGGSEEGRRCTHCQVQKTPQWRAGPLGPKTLCNACGVRFKSGRLLPEYRPAASPTFVTELHSNSHKKVLEMRSSKPDPIRQERHSRLHRQQPRSPPPQDQEELSSSTCSQESTTSPPLQH